MVRSNTTKKSGYEVMGKKGKKEQAKDPQLDLYEIADWLASAKKPLSERAKEFGEEEEAIRHLANNWPGIDRAISKFDPEIRNSIAAYTSGSGGWFRSRDPTDPNQWWNESPTAISRYISSATGTVATLMGTSPSPQPEMQKISEIFQRPVREKQRRQFVAAELGRISPELRNKFEDAWRIWYTGDENSTNNALLGMREAVDHTVKHLSKEGQPFQAQSYAEERKARIRWIATNLVSDPLKQQPIIEASETFQRLYSDLSDRAKKLGSVPRDVAKKLLIQAQDLLNLLLTSI